MDPRLVTAVLGNAYELTLESLNGRPVIRARCTDPDTGLKVVLTFPVEGTDDLGHFKQRLLRQAIAQLDRKQGFA